MKGIKSIFKQVKILMMKKSSKHFCKNKTTFKKPISTSNKSILCSIEVILRRHQSTQKYTAMSLEKDFLCGAIKWGNADTFYELAASSSLT